MRFGVKAPPLGFTFQLNDIEEERDMASSELKVEVAVTNELVSEMLGKSFAGIKQAIDQRLAVGQQAFDLLARLEQDDHEGVDICAMCFEVKDDVDGYTLHKKDCLLDRTLNAAGMDHRARFDARRRVAERDIDIIVGLLYEEGLLTHDEIGESIRKQGLLDGDPPPFVEVSFHMEPSPGLTAKPVKRWMRRPSGSSFMVDLDTIGGADSLAAEPVPATETGT